MGTIKIIIAVVGALVVFNLIGFSNSWAASKWRPFKGIARELITINIFAILLAAIMIVVFWHNWR